MRLGRAAALLAVMLVVGPASADPAAPCRGRDLSSIAGLAEARAKRVDDLVDGDGLLWRVEKPGLPPSYLFGTIHSTDEGALAVARRAAERIADAKVVATELGGPIDAAEKASLSAAMLARALDRDHDTFDDAPAADRQAIEGMVANLHYPPELARHLKLWFLAVLTSMPACEAARQAMNLPEVDEFLAEQAKAAGVKVVALETPQEQLDIIASTPPEVSATLLAVAARHPDRADDAYVTLLKLYREGRPAEILPISDALEGLSPTERAAEDRFADLILAGRNATMAKRLEPLLESGGAFVAVGALHLTGREGLIERLRAAGYTVTNAW